MYFSIAVFMGVCKGWFLSLRDLDLGNFDVRLVTGSILWQPCACIVLVKYSKSFIYIIYIIILLYVLVCIGLFVLIVQDGKRSGRR